MMARYKPFNNSSNRMWFNLQQVDLVAGMMMMFQNKRSRSFSMEDTSRSKNLDKVLSIQFI